MPMAPCPAAGSIKPVSSTDVTLEPRPPKPRQSRKRQYGCVGIAVFRQLAQARIDIATQRAHTLEIGPQFREKLRLPPQAGGADGGTRR